MRIVQVIDSLDVGGAERMAVSYANALAGRVAFSGLVVTRAEGRLKSKIAKNIPYLFLNRKSVLDLGAISKFVAYCKTNKVDLIHAHSSSWFIALLVKFNYPRIGIIWHDHYGLSDFITERKSFALRLASYMFKGIIVVNRKLKNWAEQELHSKNVLYIPNFPVAENASESKTRLHGVPGKQILCVANLRPQKDHLLLLDIAQKICKNHREWTFHLVGKDFNDDYSATIKNTITARNLSQNVFIYGASDDTQELIDQSEIAILTSRSEGLPVALLEYGLAAKPVVVTAVGEIPDIIIDGKNGFIVSAGDIENFSDALNNMIGNPDLRKTIGTALQQTITANYSEDAAMTTYLQWLNTIQQ